MPAAPTMGLIFSLRNRFRSLANMTPPTESMMKPMRPRPMMMSVSNCRNSLYSIFTETHRPKRMEMRFTSSFWAEAESELSTPHSRRRLPNMRKPTSGRDTGAMRPATTQMVTGKRILAVCET